MSDTDSILVSASDEPRPTEEQPNQMPEADTGRDSPSERPPESVDELLDRIQDSGGADERIDTGDLLDSVGRHSFGPVLLAIGLFLSVPGPSDIPGVPSLMGTVIVVLAIQILLRREHVWVPNWIERRSVKKQTLDKAVSWLRRPASWLDRISKPRWHLMVNRIGATVIGFFSVVIALATPLMELVPLSGNLAGIAFAVFGLSIISRDGLLATVAIAIATGVLGLIGHSLVT